MFKYNDKVIIEVGAAGNPTAFESYDEGHHVTVNVHPPKAAKRD